MEHPYHNQPDHRFWRRSVADVEVHLFDPVVEPRFEITPEMAIATAGSCFAQHIARALVDAECNFYVTEPGEEFSTDERLRRGYGVFSARYGNIYTTLQLNQLFDEAYGARVPADRAWQRSDGHWVDPVRQQVEPGGFASEADVLRDRALHLAAVRRMFSECDLFVFTLGLTECWISRSDGTAFSAAPGVMAHVFDPACHAFVNLDVARCYEELSQFLSKLRTVNPTVRALLTVSPVPLVATAEERSVAVATAYSKAVLRVVADMAWRNFDWVDYFPSFEIITGSQAGGRYFEEDRREVNRLGVAHAMRCFLGHYVMGNGETASAPPAADRSYIPQMICDEEALDAREAM